mmetsp:Transcript_2165/g.8453  ORF Transcript_2165/g.8453 Transcript_2165/m.8453 type:complete len:344 (-) Transcript_2165:1401-2432(-)
MELLRRQLLARTMLQQCLAGTGSGAAGSGCEKHLDVLLKWPSCENDRATIRTHGSKDDFTVSLQSFGGMCQGAAVALDSLQHQLLVRAQRLGRKHQCATILPQCQHRQAAVRAEGLRHLTEGQPILDDCTGDHAGSHAQILRQQTKCSPILRDRHLGKLQISSQEFLLHELHSLPVLADSSHRDFFVGPQFPRCPGQRNARMPHHSENQLSVGSQCRCRFGEQGRFLLHCLSHNYRITSKLWWCELQGPSIEPDSRQHEVAPAPQFLRRSHHPEPAVFAHDAQDERGVLPQLRRCIAEHPSLLVCSQQDDARVRPQREGCIAQRPTVALHSGAHEVRTAPEIR